MVAFVNRLSEEPEIDVALSPGEFEFTVEEEEKLLRELVDSENSTFFVAEVDGEIIGVLNCFGGKRKATRHRAEIGISIAKGWRGQGIGNALMAAVIDWARKTKVLVRIELSVFARNKAGIHLYEKHGFQIEGTHPKAFFRNGKHLDSYTMALLLD